MKERCSKCGKKARLTCPALGGALCSQCCGTGRGGEISCTPDCSINPFGTAGYSRFREMDSALTAKLFKAMSQAGYTEKKMLAESRKQVLVADEEEGQSGRFGVMQDWIFRSLDEEGVTPFQSWEAAAWKGFTNDERRLLQMRRSTQLTLVELVALEGDHATRVRDLLDPDKGEFVVFDKGMADHFSESKVFYASFTKLDHFSRIEADAVELDPSHAQQLVAFIRTGSECADVDEVKEWLRLNTAKVAERHRQIGLGERKEFISGLDVVQCSVVYQSDRTADAWRDFLSDQAEFRDDPDPGDEDGMDGTYGQLEHLYLWLRRGEAGHAPKTAVTRACVRDEGKDVEVLAIVSVFPEHIAVRGIGEGLFEWLRNRWESELAPGMEIVAEISHDLSGAIGGDPISLSDSSEAPDLWPIDWERGESPE